MDPQHSSSDSSSLTSLNALRAGSATAHGAAPPPAYSAPRAEGVFLADEASEALLASLPPGVGGGVRLAEDLDTRKFRRDKLSRLFRLQRGTRCFRFTLLLLSVLIVFSGYMQFDLPAITVDRLLPKLHIGMGDFSAIFIGYSVSNTIVPLLSGPFFSRMGKWRGVTIIAVTITFGVAIVYAGMVASSFPVVVLGRAVYGLGGESVFVGVDILVTKWFNGHEIGFAYGLIQAAGQAGSFTALYTVPPLVTAFGGEVDNVYLISLVLSLGALLALLVARILEKTAYGRRPAPAPQASAAAVHDAVLQLAVGGHFAGASATELEAHATRSGGSSGGHAKALAASLLDNAEDGAASDAKSGAAAQELHESAGAPHGGEGDGEDGEEGDTDIISAELRGRLSQNLAWAQCFPPLYHTLLFLGVGHMFSLRWQFWCVLGSIICYSSAFYTLLSLGPAWLMDVHHMGADEAGQTAGIVAICSMLLSPSMGLVMDRYGGQRYVCAAAMLSACAWFAIMGFTRLAPAVCIVFAGISYSLLPASLYPLLPEFVPEESFTTVYAILNSLINLVFTVVLAVTGQILGRDSPVEATRRGALLLGLGDEPHGAGVDPAQYDIVFAIFILITLVGCGFTTPLAVDAWRHGTGGPLSKKHGH